ncbi:MAG: hypothetical protein ABI646_00445 [Acidobacteriota bacterium]
MKRKLLLLTTFISFAAAGCGGASDQAANTTPVANPGNAVSGTAQKAPTVTPTPDKTPEAEETKTVTVRFPTGATEASYTDSFAGYGTIDYKFDAKAGQNLTAEITSSDRNKAILTVMRNGVAVDDDSSTVQGWTGLLPSSGSYVIRIGQMREDARSGSAPVKFGLKIQIVN